MSNRTRGLFEQERTYAPKPKSFLLPNGDKQHHCGCVTFWHKWGVLFYRTACKLHRDYVNRIGGIYDGDH